MHSVTEHAPYTWDDRIALDEDDLRELVDGELVEIEVPNFKHEESVEGSEALEPSSFSGLTIPLAKLWG